MAVSAANPLSDLGLALPQVNPATEARKQLGQDDFLRLMTTQMKFQDPFKPLDATQFLGQIAQFSTVSGIQSLNDSFSSLTGSLQSNQALQAAQLVGHGVLVPSSEAVLLEGYEFSGAVDLPASGEVTVEIADAAGQVVRSLDLGTQPAGLSYFDWDGRDAQGAALPSGQYSLRARQAQGSGEQSVETFAIGLVNSVSLGSNGLTLNLQGMSPASFNSVRQIF